MFLSWILATLQAYGLFKSVVPWPAAALVLALGLTQWEMTTLRKLYRIKRVDSAALLMHKVDRHRTIVVSNITVVQQLTRERVVEIMHATYLKNEIYHCRPTFSPLWGHYWEPVTLNLDEHLFFHEEPRTEADLRADFSASLQRAIPADKPVWQVHVFLNVAGGRSALVFQLHHALGDGVSLLRQWLQAVEVDGVLSGVVPATAAKPAKPAKPVAGAAPAPAPAAARPRKSGKPSAAAALWNMAKKTPTALYKVLLASMDRNSPLKTSAWIKPESRRLCDWHTVACSVEDIKAASRALDAEFSVNDVLMAALAEAVTERFPPAQFPVDPKVIMWVSLSPLDSVTKPLKRPLQLFNAQDLSFVYYDLPCKGKPAPTAPGWALAETKKRLAALIGSPEPLVTNWLFRVFGYIPTFLVSRIWDHVAYVSTISCSNMRTPSGRLTWAGGDIQDVSFGVPVQGNIGLFCCIFSFNNRVTFSVNCDARLIDEKLLHRFVHDDFNNALARTLQHMHASAAAKAKTQ